MRSWLLVSGVLSVACATPAMARDEARGGAYVGAAIAAADHHFVVERTTSAGTTRENVTRWGPAGNVFAGFDLPLDGPIVLGLEGEFDFGGRTAKTVLPGGQIAAITPRYGFGVTAHAGLRAGGGVLLYAKAGYGQHLYRQQLPPGAGDLTRTASFILGGGAEYRLTRRVSVRLDFEHLDGSRNQFSIGIPIRF